LNFHSGRLQSLYYFIYSSYQTSKFGQPYKKYKSVHFIYYLFIFSRFIQLIIPRLLLEHIFVVKNFYKKLNTFYQFLSK